MASRKARRPPANGDLLLRLDHTIGSAVRGQPELQRSELVELERGRIGGIIERTREPLRDLLQAD